MAYLLAESDAFTVPNAQCAGQVGPRLEDQPHKQLHRIDLRTACYITTCTAARKLLRSYRLEAGWLSLVHVYILQDLDVSTVKTLIRCIT